MRRMEVLDKAIERRIKNLELLQARALTPEERERQEDERIEELVEKVKTMFPEETELWEAYERSRSLESSELQADIEEYVEAGKFILREISRLKSEQPQPSK